MDTNYGLYYKHIMIINDDSRVVRITILVVTSPTIVILRTLGVSFMLLENIYSTGITYDHHLRSPNFFIVQATETGLFLALVSKFVGNSEHFLALSSIVSFAPRKN